MLAVLATAIWMVSPDNPPGPPRPIPTSDSRTPTGGVHLVDTVATTVFKGKLFTAAVSLLFPPFSWVAAIRLARPGSPWARLRYTRNPAKAARASNASTPTTPGRSDPQLVE